MPYREDISPVKKVLDINEEQAKALLANLSDKSIETLRMFVAGDPVEMDELVGENCPYASFVELKRSFVGPVNRRLRTVTRDRTAVLFRRVDTEDGEQIAIKPGTAGALKKALI